MRGAPHDLEWHQLPPAAIRNVWLTSTPAVRGANNWGVIQFDEEGRVIPTWEDDDDGDAA